MAQSFSEGNHLASERNAAVSNAQFQIGSELADGLAEIGIMPYAVMRRAGVSPVTFQKLIFNRTLAIIDHYLDLEAFCKGRSSALITALERIIGTTQPPEARRELIQLRRDIFNDRLPKHDLTAVARDRMAQALSLPEHEALVRWLKYRQEREELLREGERAFLGELSTKRALFKKLFRNLEFRKGLALGSQTLSYELEQYLKIPEDGTMPRLQRTERALIRYYSRCAFKLSPFSSFTRTALIRIPENAEKELGIVGFPRYRIQRRTTVNRALIGDLAHCISRHPKLGGYVPLFVSRTFSKEGETFLLVRHRHADSEPVRVRMPQESLVCMSKTRATQWIVDFLESRGGAAHRKELTTALASSLDDIRAASAYVDSLVELGLIVHKVPLPEDDTTGLEALASFLASIPSPVAATVRQSLHELQSLVGQFAKAGPAARLDLIGKMVIVIENAYRALGIDSPPKWAGLLLYEDCVERPISTLSDSVEWRPALRDLSEFLSCYSVLLDGNIPAREAIRHLLRTEFADGPVSFLHLAQRYNKLHSGNPTIKQGSEGDYTPNPLGLTSLSELAEIRREFGSFLTQGSEMEEIDVGVVAKQKRWPERIRRLGLTPSIGSVVSTSCYCQPVLNWRGDWAMVVNKVHAGPFRALLRFCNGPSDSHGRERILKDVRPLLKRIWRQAEPCEVLARFDFNINLCPSVTERVINYANDPNLGAKGIGVGSLFLRVVTDGSLMLTEGSSSGDGIVPVNFGMMATPFQPPLEYLLLSLGVSDPALYKPFDPFSWSIRREEQDTVVRFPRLTFGRCILRRRGWSVLRQGLPHRDSKDNDFGYFLRVRRWQRSLELPDEVFARAQTFEESLPESSESSTQRNRNLYKPQYIHFGNYFLVDILGVLFRESSKQLYIEEMQPDWNSWRCWELQRPVEFVLDAYVNTSAASSETSQEHYGAHKEMVS